ncbi:MAG: hypothetical protein SFY81_12915 [Verrucomicrobiota bacterium]|nr:hypothetical protein [Verrucomicrobiota bacterium]
MEVTVGLSLLFLLHACTLFAQTNQPAFQKIPSETLENLFLLQAGVYSGGSPQSSNSFKELADRGIKTIISVDGARPEVETARAHGIRYIHIPMGYDGTTVSNMQRIVKAAQSAGGPVYLHCHHGKHRGPAAAAVVCQGLGLWDNSQGESWLKAAGTSPDYPGLFEMVKHFQPVAPAAMAAIPDEFPEAVRPSSMVEAMVLIDKSWEELEAFQKEDYKISAAHPDFSPARSAMLLAESYRELARSPEAARLGEDFLKRLQAAEVELLELRRFLKESEGRVKPAQGAVYWSRVAKSCRDCHRQYRN